LEEELASFEVLQNQPLYRKLSQEFAYLSSLKETWESLLSVDKELREYELLQIEETDLAMKDFLEAEAGLLRKKQETLRQKVEFLLIPPDPLDSRSIILELRAGTGGDEAALFVADCARMYRNYAVQKGWAVELLSSSESELGGYKEYIVSLSGDQVHRCMQYEAGIHRVQRVPATETQGRIHTSAVTVAILLEPSDDEMVVIEDKDLRVDTYRASGAGGQHVNRTDSAVRLTHLPTGIVVACQDERSQHKNKEKAMRLLLAKISEEKRRSEAEKTSSLRQQQVGSGDRSGRIRTYNFPQNRVTDHRISLTIYNLDRFMEGELDLLILPLIQYFYEQKLQ
jgi:peptide chain release factor 1